MAQGFKFSDEYQLLLLACMVRHGEDFAYMLSDLKANYFTGIQSTLAARVILTHHKQYDRYPSWTVLRELMLVESAKLPDKDAETTEQFVAQLRQMDTADFQSVRDRVGDFLRERAVVEALRQSLEHIKAGTTPADGFAPMFEVAGRVGENLDNLGILLHKPDDVRNVVATVTSSDYGVLTGYPLLDKIWPRGWGPGWLVVPLAPPKRYKTGLCINLACNMASPGIAEDIIYYACEIDEKLAMARALCHVSGLSFTYMYENPAKFVEQALETIKQSVRSNVLFKSFSSKAAAMSDLKAHAKQAKKQLKGFNPKAIFVDYAETVKPDEVSKNDPEYRRSAAVYTGARELGKSLGACVVMPDRCNKETTDRPTPSMTSFQGSFEKAGIVDVAFGLCATDNEHKNNQLRLFNFLNRHGGQYQHLGGTVDPETWRIEFNKELDWDEDKAAEEDKANKKERGGRGAWKKGGKKDDSHLPPELREGQDP